MGSSRSSSRKSTGGRASSSSATTATSSSTSSTPQDTTTLTASSPATPSSSSKKKKSSKTPPAKKSTSSNKRASASPSSSSKAASTKSTAKKSPSGGSKKRGSTSGGGGSTSSKSKASKKSKKNTSKAATTNAAEESQEESVKKEASQDQVQPDLPPWVLIVDTGGYTVKHGLIHLPPPSSSDVQQSNDKLPLQAPNATAKLKHQVSTLVADEIYDPHKSVQNKSQLDFTRPTERGYCVNLGCQVQIWKRLLELHGLPLIAPPPFMTLGGGKAAGGNKRKRPRPTVHATPDPTRTTASTTLATKPTSQTCCTLLLVQPFTPACISDNTDECWFHDVHMKFVAKVLVQCMAAYRYVHRTSHHHDHGSRRSSREQMLWAFPNDATVEEADGTECCLVVDSGFSLTHIVPTVHGGLAVERAIRRINIGGRLLTNHLKECITYRQWNMMDEVDLVNDVKERLCFVSTQGAAQDLHEAAKCDNGHGNGKRRRWFDREYVLPDFVDRLEGTVLIPPGADEDPVDWGYQSDSSNDDDDDDDEDGGELNDNDNGNHTKNKKKNKNKKQEESQEDRFLRIQRRKHLYQTRADFLQKCLEKAAAAETNSDVEGPQILRVSTERFAIPEVLFQPTHVGLEQVGLAEAIQQSVEACPEEYRAALWRNVLVVGGNAKLKGLGKRLKKELRRLAPCGYEVRVFVPEDPVEYSWRGARDWCMNGGGGGCNKEEEEEEKKKGYSDGFTLRNVAMSKESWEKEREEQDGSGREAWVKKGKDSFMRHDGEKGLVFL